MARNKRLNVGNQHSPGLKLYELYEQKQINQQQHHDKKNNSFRTVEIPSTQLFDMLKLGTKINQFVSIILKQDGICQKMWILDIPKYVMVTAGTPLL